MRVTHLAVRGMPRSGTPGELYERFGLSAAHIARAIRNPAAVLLAPELEGAGTV